MDESVQEQQKGGLSKKTIAIVIGLLLIIGGAVSAYVLLDKTTKEKYFLAEKATFEFIGESFEEKYNLENEWGEKKANNPNKAEHRINLAMDSAGMGGDSFGMVDPFDIISNVTFMFDVESNTDEQEIAFDLGVDFANLDLGKIGISIAQHDLFVELPFTDDILHIADNELNELLTELDPYTFTEDDLIDFDSIFELFTNNFISEKDIEYLQKEYGEFLFDAVPESAFEEEKDSITAHGEKLKTDKITLHLTEDEVKNILEEFFTKLSNDERINDMFEKIFELQFAAGSSLSDDDAQVMYEIMDEFDEGLEFAKENVSNLHIPDGLTSIVWIDQKKIVQRDFSLTIGPDANDVVSLAIEGTHLLEKDKQQFDIDVIAGDSYEEFTTTFEGELNWKNNKGDDYITLRADDVEITYEAVEEVKDKSTKEFTRSLRFVDDFEEFEFTWDGDATYASEKMKSSHTLAFIEDGITDEMSIHVDKKASIIKDVAIPSKSDAVLLGEMELFEIDMYAETLANEFEIWLQGLTGGMFGF